MLSPDGRHIGEKQKDEDEEEENKFKKKSLILTNFVQNMEFQPVRPIPGFKLLAFDKFFQNVEISSCSADL